MRRAVVGQFLLFSVFVLVAFASACTVSPSTIQPMPSVVPTQAVFAIPTSQLATVPPTAIPVSATPRPTSTPEPTKVPTYEPPVPEREKTISNVLSERYNMIDDQNAKRYFITVSREELVALRKEQPDKALFPFSPRGKFSIGTYTAVMPAFRDAAGRMDGPWDTTAIVIYSADVSVFAPIDGDYSACSGTYISNTGGRTSEISQWVMQFGVSPAEYKVKFDPVFPGSVYTRPMDNPCVERQARATGDHLLEFIGSGPLRYASGDLSEPNRLTFEVSRYITTFPGEPVVLEGKQMMKNRTNKIENLTPSLLDTSGWLTKDSRIAVLRPES